MNEILVCGKKSFFDDDVHDKCNRCKADIIYRPYNTTVLEKICIPCAIKEAEKPK